MFLQGAQSWPTRRELSKYYSAQDVKSLTPTKETWKTESCAGTPVGKVDGIVTVKFWYGGLSGVDDWNWGSKGPLTRTVPKNSPAGRQEPPGHDNIPITTAISTEPVKLSYRNNVSAVYYVVDIV